MQKAPYTAGYVLLDTDVFSYLTKPDPIRAPLYQPHVIDKTLAISFVTVGEVLFGARRRKWDSGKISNLRLSLNNFIVLPYDMALCEIYANLKAEEVWPTMIYGSLQLPYVILFRSCQTIELISKEFRV